MRKYKAFTLAEAILTLIIIGIIATLSMVVMKPENMSQKSFDTKGEKAVSTITQALTSIYGKDASFDDFSRIRYKENEYIYLKNPDEGDKFVEILKRYIVVNDKAIDLTDAFFSENLLNYKKQTVGLKSEFSNFFFLQDSVLIGFKFYTDCAESEMYAIAPGSRETFEVKNVCLSMLIDTNGFTRPNKLGSDEFIIPVGLRGIKYSNSEDE